MRRTFFEVKEHLSVTFYSHSSEHIKKTYRQKLPDQCIFFLIAMYVVCFEEGKIQT